MSLTGKDRRHLRGLGHSLEPALHVGKEGVTAALATAADTAFARRELIKVKILEHCPADRERVAADLAERTSSEIAQILGRTFLLFRRHPEEPEIVLPSEGAAPRS